MEKKESIRTRIWRETAEPDNPFTAASCHCHGYDVYGDLLGNATWIEYLFLLFKGEPPDTIQRQLLEKLAIVLANPGPRDHSVQAAMNGGVGGSDYAACLIAALAVGAGQLGGAREVSSAMILWKTCDKDIERWEKALSDITIKERADVWPAIEHPPGFDPHGVSCSSIVKHSLEYLSYINTDGVLSWICEHRLVLEKVADRPLAMSGVCAAALVDLDFSPSEGEMLYLFLRLPGAAVHALEQEKYGFRNFPFYWDNILLVNDPASASESSEIKYEENL